MELCGWVVQWAQHASAPRRARLLELLPSVAFEKHAGNINPNSKPSPNPSSASAGDDLCPPSLASAKTPRGSVASAERWELVRREPPMATLATDKEHTTHPYSVATETIEVHRIPGAEALEARAGETRTSSLPPAPNSNAPAAGEPE